MKNRIELANKTAKGIVAEIGVASGNFSQIIFNTSQVQKLYLIDCWESQNGEYSKDPANANQEIQNQRFIEVNKFFKNNPKVSILKMYSHEAVKLFHNEYFDWIYIDADHTKPKRIQNRTMAHI